MIPTDRSSGPQALTIDVWYTLVYVTGSERRRLDAERRRLWSAPLRAAGLSGTRTRRLLADRERWTRTEEARGRTPSVAAQLDWLSRASRLRLRAEALPERLDRVLVRASIRLAPGAPEAIELLAREGIALGIVSNVLNESGEAARTVLDRLGLLSRFRVVVLSCEQPWAKPSPEPFRLACRFLGVRPGDALHVGDLGYDLRGARAAGMRAWWYAGLRRFNRYLPGQVRRSDLASGSTLRSWDELSSRLSAPAQGSPARPT